MVVPILVEVDRAAYPTVPLGELLADRLTACEVPDLEATVAVRWPGLNGGDRRQIRVWSRSWTW